MAPLARSTSSVSGGSLAGETHQATPASAQPRTSAVTSGITSSSGRVVRDQVAWAAGKVGLTTQSGYLMSRYSSLRTLIAPSGHHSIAAASASTHCVVHEFNG